MAESTGFEPPDRNYPFNRLAGGCLQLLGRRTEQPDAGEEDHAARDQRGPIIRRLVSLAADERDRDADRGGPRADRVAPLVPGVGVHRSAPDGPSDAVHALEESLFD